LILYSVIEIIIRLIRIGKFGNQTKREFACIAIHWMFICWSIKKK